MIKLFLSISSLFVGMAVLTSCSNADNTTVNPSTNSGNVGSTSSNYNISDDYYLVQYELNGHGNQIKTEAVDKGEDAKATLPKNPAASGYRFKGWYKDEALTELFDFNSVLTSDIKLYAKWKEYKGVSYDTDKTPTIYLAGDSTVQTYADEQYIGGWGQYFNWFFDEDIKVVNAARGGRSSRSFINEDRLFTPTDGAKYSFSENGGKAIEDTIEAGDYLFVQFGHNDDDTKSFDDTSYKYERMVPLGTPDENGIYPVVKPETKVSTSTNLPTDMKDSTKTEIAKYGSEYYQYGEGTYKGYLKMYIDFAREKGATPVLVTPVARVSFDSNGKIKGGPGLHGDDFAYVKAVRQLAEEENCLLIDNFTATKEMLEIATKDFSDFLMAIVPNSLDNGAWPNGYDSAYKNTAAGYQKMEGTHYNKYGAFLTACNVVNQIIKYDMDGKTVTNGDNVEYFDFVEHILEKPYKYINPSNRLSIAKAKAIETLFEEVNPTDPERTYVQADVAIKAIEDLKAKGGLDSITSENWETWVDYCNEARSVYESLNYDIRENVTNYNDLVQYEERAKSARPRAYKTVVLSADDFVNVTTPITKDGHTFSFSSDIITYTKTGAAFEFNETNYGNTTKSIRLPGNSSGNTIRYVEFNVTGKCEITLVASGGGDAARTITLTDTSKKEIAAYTINPSQTKETWVIEDAGTYRVGSKGSNIDLYYIIIEYYE